MTQTDQKENQAMTATPWQDRPYEVGPVRRTQHNIKQRGFYNRITLYFKDGQAPSNLSVPLGEFNKMRKDGAK